MLGYYGNMVAPGNMVASGNMMPFQMTVGDDTPKYSHQPQNGAAPATPLGYNPGDWAQTFHQSPDITTGVDCTERGEIEGANDEDILYPHEQVPVSYRVTTPYQTPARYHGHGQFETVPGQHFGANGDSPATPMQDNGGQQQPPDVVVPTERTPPQYHWSPNNGHQGDVEAEYHVKYVGGRVVENTPNGGHQGGRPVEMPPEPQRQDMIRESSADGVVRTSHDDQLQRKFLEQGNYMTFPWF